MPNPTSTPRQTDHPEPETAKLLPVPVAHDPDTIETVQVTVEDMLSLAERLAISEETARRYKQKFIWWMDQAKYFTERCQTLNDDLRERCENCHDRALYELYTGQYRELKSSMAASKDTAPDAGTPIVIVLDQDQQDDERGRHHV